jgi:hypothetical protein
VRRISPRRQEIGTSKTLADVVGVPDEGDRSQTNCDEKRSEGDGNGEEDALETVHRWFGGGHMETSCCIFTIEDGAEFHSEWDHGLVKNPTHAGFEEQVPPSSLRSGVGMTSLLATLACRNDKRIKPHFRQNRPEMGHPASESGFVSKH